MKADKLVRCSRERYLEFVAGMSLQNARAIDGTLVSATQWVGNNGEVVAQAFYQRATAAQYWITGE